MRLQFFVNVLPRIAVTVSPVHATANVLPVRPTQVVSIGSAVHATASAPSVASAAQINQVTPKPVVASALVLLPGLRSTLRITKAPVHATALAKLPGEVLAPSAPVHATANILAPRLSMIVRPEPVHASAIVLSLLFPKMTSYLCTLDASPTYICQLDAVPAFSCDLDVMQR
jgi:hypothetical protein